MNWNGKRVALAVIDGFAAVSAFGGGYAVMAGMTPPDVDLASGPLGWLISDYFVAGAILAVVVGGTALAAAIGTVLSRTAGAGLSFGAGLVMIGWIVGEVVLIGPSSWLQLAYGVVGIAMLALGFWLEPGEMRRLASGTTQFRHRGDAPGA